MEGMGELEGGGGAGAAVRCSEGGHETTQQLTQWVLCSDERLHMYGTREEKSHNSPTSTKRPPCDSFKRKLCSKASHSIR